MVNQRQDEQVEAAAGQIRFGDVGGADKFRWRCEADASRTSFFRLYKLKTNIVIFTFCYLLLL